MNEKVSLQDLAAMVADDCKISRKKADQFIRDMFDVILEALKKEKYVKIKGLGTFKLTEVSPRVSVNVSTGERFEIQGHRKITFTPENKIKELINKPFAHFEPVVLNEGVQFDDVSDDVEKDVEMDTEEVTEKSVIPETTTVEEETKEQEPEPIQEEAVVDEPILEETKEELVEEAPEVEKNPEVEKIAEILTEEPTLETPIEEKPVVVSPDPIPLMQTKKKTPWGWIIGVLCALLIIALVVWLLQPQKAREVPYEIYQPEKTVVSSAPTDSLQQGKTDEVISTQPETVKEEVVTPKPVETPKPVTPAVQPAVPSLSTTVVKETIADTLEYRITGLKATYTLKEGETLARVAANFYQNRRLWPYIAKYNKDILPNVNRVVPGMVIRVPELAPVE